MATSNIKKGEFKEEHYAKMHFVAKYLRNKQAKHQQRFRNESSKGFAKKMQNLSKAHSAESAKKIIHSSEIHAFFLMIKVNLILSQNAKQNN